MAVRACGLLLSIVGSFAFSAVSFAQNADKIHVFSIAPEVSNYEYKEPGLMKLSGTMVGVSGEYLNNGGVGKIKGSIPIQLRGRLTYMQGELKYDGHYMSGEPVKFSKKDNDNYFYDTAALGGVEFKLGGGSFISPYAGFGYRYLVDEKARPSDYKREQTYYYLPIGADWKKPLPSGWSLAVNTELDILLRGKNKTHLNDGYTFRQKRGYGLRTSFKGEKNLQSVGIFAEPFFRYWNIGKSNVKDGYVEPKNRTTEYGLRVGVTF